jgi:hypothetical protein
MSGDAYMLEERKDGWCFVMGGRESPVFASREQAALAAELEKNDRKSENEEELETGLEGTFPASDPVSVSNPSTSGAPEGDRRS